MSNPPYSVNDCKDDLEYLNAQHNFTLYPYLSDKSKDIECLFVERTKHLLKDNGIAAIILPSSILNNNGIQTKAREIILQNFDIIAITELGSNTFMATGTNTVILFLKRRSNKKSADWKESLNIFFENKQDITINGIENSISKYVNHSWQTISFDDYIGLIKKEPNQKITEHEIYKEYRKKIKAKNEREFWEKLLAIEKEKLYYFIIAYKQKIVLIKTGEKDAEKRFLGYEFSNRRGGEGMHPIQRGKDIDDCTQLYSPTELDNPTKASTYIYDAFLNKHDREIDETIKNNVFRQNLVDMLTFDRVEFEKNISLSVKKKVKIESKWEMVRLGDILYEQSKSKIQVGEAKDNLIGNYNFFTSGESVLKYNEIFVIFICNIVA